jgi:CRP-like cAMP-binding protein
MLFDEFDRVIFSSGQEIFHYGDLGDCAYLIEEGQVEVQFDNGRTTKFLARYAPLERA